MLTIGSRGSTLALTQVELVKAQLLERFPDLEVTVRIIRTSFDRDTTTSIRAGSGTGVFVKEIEEALMAGEIDLAVHSMKDLPSRIPGPLEIAAIPRREDAHDALVTRERIRRIEDLPEGAVIGTGSIRRQAQLLALRPDLEIRDIRGNVETRLRKLDAGGYDALILACAGLKRLRLQERIDAPLDFSVMLPAPGQGALALEIRKDDAKTREIVEKIDDSPTASAVRAERSFLRRMGGGCNTPVAVHAFAEDGLIRLTGLVAAPDGTKILRETAASSPAEGAGKAAEMAEKLLAAGGSAILESLPRK